MAHDPSHTMQSAALTRGSVISSTFLAMDAFARLGAESKAEYLARRPGLHEHTLGNNSRTPSSAGLRLLDSSLVPGVRSIDLKVANGPGRGGANDPHVRAPPTRNERLKDGVLLHATARLHVSLGAAEVCWCGTVASRSESFRLLT